jgi:Ca2+:H+ antiporter
LSWILHFTGLQGIWIFITSAISLLPLANLIGHATEQLANRTGPGIGGLLNATFGNAPELIIGLFALNAGLHEVVKASISGSILSNILFVLGTSMLAGGWHREKQTFSQRAAGANAAMLFLAVVALVMPAVFDLSVFGSLEATGLEIEELSLLVAGVLLLTYIATIIFSLTGRHGIYRVAESEEGNLRLGLTDSLLLLGGATGLAAFQSELLVGSISLVTGRLGLSEFFMGVIIIALVGNAAEHFSAVTMAAQNRMDLSMTIATSSSTQIALFVAPVLIFASLLFGQPLSLVFNAFEIASLTLAVLILAIVSLDGESNWLEGLQLVAIYIVLAIVFYFVPSM